MEGSWRKRRTGKQGLPGGVFRRERTEKEPDGAKLPSYPSEKNKTGAAENIPAAPFSCFLSPQRSKDGFR